MYHWQTIVFSPFNQVANLAAYLTLNSIEGVSTVEGAIAAGYTICAHPVLKAGKMKKISLASIRESPHYCSTITELETRWPLAKFYFHQEGKEYRGVLDDYVSGKCNILAMGSEDISTDFELVNRLCENDLVLTTSVLVEIPIAFPARDKIASGFSHWIYEANRNGITVEKIKDKFRGQTSW